MFEAEDAVCPKKAHQFWISIHPMLYLIFFHISDWSICWWKKCGLVLISPADSEPMNEPFFLIITSFIYFSSIFTINLEKFEWHLLIFFSASHVPSIFAVFLGVGRADPLLSPLKNIMGFGVLRFFSDPRNTAEPTDLEGSCCDPERNHLRPREPSVLTWEKHTKEVCFQWNLPCECACRHSKFVWIWYECVLFEEVCIFCTVPC